ncbi:MAG: bifunctional diaminohydroxyphosphoribosylaminopyrimidine deaminase/5-amino-6-(5-phosphoribosylamino)uracil reductase RibD [Oligoflexia bacterium]|nr:bifunctional diaminohydroxyphosphoribosylaminopyrimidine deaminase/5-amino-6-(5-phosphoribosylamino)uracil reductase RibD [Oligoflexia bacterium]
MSFNQQDIFYLSKTLELAEKGRGMVAPNPLVGALWTSDDGTAIWGEGFHQRYGGAHAEVWAIEGKESEGVSGGTLYCNMEPCVHTNKQTPPCVDLIIRKKIQRVVIILTDPNPLVNGDGLKKLAENGITVSALERIDPQHHLVQAAKKQNEIFIHFMQKQRPFIHLKWAQTLDGQLATSSGDSKWITSEAARKEAHRLRAKYQAVLVGTNTVITDNPKLNVRYGLGDQQPYRIIIGTNNLREIPYPLQILTDELKERTLLFNPADFPSLHCMLVEIGKQKISSILVEGGGYTLTQFLKEHLADKITVFIAPKIIGKGLGIDSLGIEKMSDALVFHEQQLQLKILDNDHFIFTGYPKY